jgi:hypothetical protein
MPQYRSLGKAYRGKEAGNVNSAKHLPIGRVVCLDFNQNRPLSQEVGIVKSSQDALFK